MSLNVKTAVLISGYMRHFETSYNTYMKYFNNEEYDIFIYTSKNGNIKNSYNKGFIRYDKKETKEHIKKFYKNDVVQIMFSEDDEDYEKHFKTIYNPKKDAYYNYAMRDQFLRVKLCYKMALEYEKNNNVKYNSFIRIRPDTFIIGNIDFKNIIKKMIRYSIYVIPYVNYCNMVDFFFLCPRSSSDFIFDAYLELGNFTDHNKTAYQSVEGQFELYIESKKIQKMWLKSDFRAFNHRNIYNKEIGSRDEEIHNYFTKLNEQYENRFIVPFLDLNLFYIQAV